MARFFLDLHECGASIVDDEGVEFDSTDAARRAALQAAREIMAAEVAEGRLCLAAHVAIRDEAGAVMAAVPFQDAVSIIGPDETPCATAQ